MSDELKQRVAELEAVIKALDEETKALWKENDRMREALERFAKIESDGGDDFEGVHEDVILRVEITAGDLHAVREALSGTKEIK